MGFLEEIVKEKRKILPYVQLGLPDNTERLYSYAHEGTYREAIKGTVQSFGAFNRSLANSMFTLEIPNISVTLIDPEREWRALGEEPFNELVHKWLQWYLRVHDDQDDIYDGTIAIAQIQDPSFPPGRKVVLPCVVTPGHVFSERLPRRTVTADDWPKSPPESIGRPVPIIYGRHSNVVNLPPELVINPCGCPEWTPSYVHDDIEFKYPDAPGTTAAGAAMGSSYGIYWSDHFTTGPNALEDSKDSPGSAIDAWINTHYRLVYQNMEIVPGAGPDGIRNALVSEPNNPEARWAGEISKWVGHEFWYARGNPAYGGDLDFQSMGGPNASQYGAAGMYCYHDSACINDAYVKMRVWGRQYFTSGGFGDLLHLDYDGGENGVGSLYLGVVGDVHRRNGAKGLAQYPNGITQPPVPLNGPQEFGDEPNSEFITYDFWQTPLMLNCIHMDTWQWIEMKWKISSVAPANEVLTTNYEGDGQYYESDSSFSGPKANMAADGWVEVRIDGQVVIRLDEIAFYVNQMEKDYTGAWTYWEAVMFNSFGKMACNYITTKGYCDEMQVTTLAESDPCAQNVPTQTAAGALAPPLVDVMEYNLLAAATGIETPAQNNAAAPTGEQGFTGTPGSIPGGVATHYRVTAVYGGQESSWSGLIECYNEEAHYDRIAWEDPPQGPPDSFRVYQMVSNDLQLHLDMGGALRAETYWVKQVSGTTHQVDFLAVGDGAPLMAATEIPIVETSWMIAGHACHVVDVYALVPPLLTETLGGLNLWNGDKEPINFADLQPRLQRLTEGTDYTVEIVEKPSGRFTIVKVTKNLRSLTSCAYYPITVNVEGITENADGSGDLIEDGPQIVKHFLLNWVFNHYTTGEWFEDVAAIPGIIDKDSFDVATEVGESFVEGGRIGAVILLQPTDARQLIIEALTSYGMGLFYRNAVGNDNGAWSGVIIDARNLDAGDLPLFAQNADILENTFGWSLSYSSMANVINYKAGPNWASGAANGWLITGTLTDGASIELYERIEFELQLPWTRHSATAADVATQELLLRRFPLLFGSFQTKGRGLAFDPGQLIAVEHTDGSGPSGWDQHPCAIIGNDYNIDQHVTTLRLMSVQRLV